MHPYYFVELLRQKNKLATRILVSIKHAETHYRKTKNISVSCWQVCRDSLSSGAQYLLPLATSLLHVHVQNCGSKQRSTIHPLPHGHPRTTATLLHMKSQQCVRSFCLTHSFTKSAHVECLLYSSCGQLDSEDWEVWHNCGLCYLHLKQFQRAVEAFEQANSISRHDSTYLQMGKVRR